MAALKVVLYVLVFPGFLFQFVFSTFLEWIDRKLYARLQNRRGPLYTGWHGILQPVADIIKLFAKEDITPKYSAPEVWDQPRSEGAAAEPDRERARSDRPSRSRATATEGART